MRAPSKSLAARVEAWPVVRAVSVDTLLIAAFPLVLLLLSREWLFDPGGYLDTWSYVGYFWHYPEHLPHFDTYYKISRLPWTLPGFLAHRLLPPVAAHVAMQLACLIGAALALFAILARCFEREAALVGALFFEAFPYTHGAGGWNYHNSGVLLYYLLSYLFLVRGADGGGRRHSLFVSGALLAMGVHTNLFIVAFGPVFALTWWALHADTRDAAWIPSARSFVEGGLAVTVVLAAVNRVTGGAFAFFVPQINYVRWISHGNPWHVALSAWIGNAHWLVIPTSIATGAAFALALRRRNLDRLSMAILASQLYAFAIMWVWELRGQTLLWPMYMGSALIPPTFLALGALVHGSGPVRDALRSDVRKFALFALLVASLALSGRIRGIAGPSTPWAELAVALVAIAALVSRVRIDPRMAAAAAIAPLVLVNGVVVPSSERYAFPANCETGADMLRVFRDADRLTERIDPSLRTRYWFSEREVLREAGCPDFSYSGAFHSFVATRGWLGNLWPAPPMKDLEQISPKDVEALAGVRFLASLSSEESRFPEFQQRLRTLGLAPEPVGLYAIRRGRLTFYIGMLRLPLVERAPSR